MDDTVERECEQETGLWKIKRGSKGYNGLG